MRNLIFVLVLVVVSTSLGCEYCQHTGGEKKRLTVKQRSWINLSDSTQHFLYSKMKDGEFVPTDTFDVLVRFIRDTLKQYAECYYGENEEVKAGFKVYKVDSTIGIYYFKQSTEYSGALIFDSLQLDTLNVLGRLYKDVYAYEYGYKCNAWYAKGFGFIRIHYPDKQYQLIPE